MSAAAIRTHGDEEQIAHSPARIAAPAKATQVVNSDEPVNSLTHRFNWPADCGAKSS